jgi:peptidyl-prolyl cis-trans isomerase B (cyclophilin B)
LTRWNAAPYNAITNSSRNFNFGDIALTQKLTRSAFFSASAVFLAGLSLMPSPVSAAPPETKPAAKPAPKAAVEHPIVTMETDKGTIKIKLYPEEAPNTVANFISLIRKGFYNGLNFHRVEPGFVIQGGDPKGNGSGGPGYAIKNENDKFLKHNRGAVAMANAGMDTAGSQFYIVIEKPAPFLDEKENGVNKYTIFGQVISGQEAAEKIQVGDKIKKVTVSGAKTPYTPVQTIKER